MLQGPCCSWTFGSSMCSCGRCVVELKVSGRVDGVHSQLTPVKLGVILMTQAQSLQHVHLNNMDLAAISGTDSVLLVSEMPFFEEAVAATFLRSVAQ